MTSSEHVAQQLTQRYNCEASDYFELWAPVLRVPGRRLLHAFAEQRPKRILDVGAGVGTLLPDLRDLFPHAFIAGVDRSRGMLRLATPAEPLAVMDATELAVASGSVDLVLMAFMLFHLQDPLEGLLEARRVLRVGGAIGVITWGGELESRAIAIWQECLDEYGAAPPAPDAQARHEAVDAPEKVEPLLEAAGFASARSWTEDLVTTIDLEHLVRLRTRMGASKPRFLSLDSIAQPACVAEARKRMGALSSEGFVARGTLVYSVART